MDSVGLLLRIVSEMSKADDDDLEREADQPNEVQRKRRSRDRSYKLTSAFRRANGGVRR
jgi:hypothetical protein